MNFNDFGASVVTLFHIMIVNNWFVTCNMICIIVGRPYPRMFFVAFWVLTVLIMLNLVISFVLDIYAETEEAVEKTYTKQQGIIKLKNNFETNEDVAEWRKKRYLEDEQKLGDYGDANETGQISLTDLIDNPDAIKTVKPSGFFGKNRATANKN